MHPFIAKAIRQQTSRRAFLSGSAAGVAGLVLGVHLLGSSKAQAGDTKAVTTEDGQFAPNAFVRVAPDNTVTVIIKHIEIGQGANTGLAVLAAEEMDASWSQIEAKQAPHNAVVYANTLFGAQGTGGSTGLSNSYMQMRQAGAAARAMLVAAAAQKWSVSLTDISVADGVVSTADGKSATFGELAEAAANQPVPVDVKLKDAKDFKLIGGEGVTRLDSKEKSTGKAQFSIDVYRDGMETVAVLHPPKFGATLTSFDATEALKIKGVRAVEQIPSGIAVYGASTFAAFKGRDAVVAQWDESEAETRSSAQIADEFMKAAANPSKVFEESGDLDAAMEGAAQIIEADYVFPYLAHASLEPMDGVIEVKDGKVEVWSGMQFPTFSEPVMAQTLGIPASEFTINTMYAGGSFGRRATPGSEFAAELANVAKARGDGSYKLLWSRKDDMTGGFYRPLTAHRMRAGVDADGNIVGWFNGIANQSIIAGSPFEAMMKDGLDPTAYEGSNELPYDVGAHRMAWAQMKGKVPVLWWRAVGHTHTAYAVETFLDEVLEKTGKDSVQGRLDIMKADRPRDRAVLERVADLANWSGAGTGDKRYGVAVVRSFGSYVAQIAEVEDLNGTPRVTRVWCALDCGVAVTPDVVRAQMEGGIGFALGTTLHSALTLGEGGTVQQTNYDTFRTLRLPEMPEVEVSIIESDIDPTGVGEPGVPPLAPAVANAWRSFTGTTPRQLPIVPVGV